MEINTNTNRKPKLPLWTRILLSIIALIVIGIIAQTFIYYIFHSHFPTQNLKEEISEFQLFLANLLWLALMLTAIYFLRVYADRQAFSTMGFSLRNRSIDLLIGLIAAIIILVGGALILSLSGHIELEYNKFRFETLIYEFLFFTCVAFIEEILFRGYILNNLMTKMNKYWALIISSLIFSLIHGLNPGISIIALLNILLAGILLGSTYIYTKNLWFPISLHLFWNFIQGPILGFNVSGNQVTKSLFLVSQNGDNIMTGGKFGFEGSIICSILCSILILLIFAYYNKKSTLDFGKVV